MSESLVKVDFLDGVARITLVRSQKRNALTREMLGELNRRVNEVAGRPDVRVVVLAAEGPAFCAGMDLSQMEATAKLPDAAAVWRADTDAYREVVAGLFSLSCPTVAVVQGATYAGGIGLVAACDLVIASDAAMFALPEPKRGITAAVVTPLLVHRVGANQAGYLLLSGRVIGADEARGMGFVHEVAPADRLAVATEDLVNSILKGAPGALATTKRQFRTCAADDVLKQLEQAAVVSAEARETAEAREGLAAFLEKREPKWAPK